MMENSPILAVVVPCYKEEAVLHETHKRLSQLFDRLIHRARLTVTGVTRIVSCDELGATLQTPLGDLTIGGQGMQVSELSVRTGEVHISGQIEYLQYTENQQSKKQSGGLLARLLR